MRRLPRLDGLVTPNRKEYAVPKAGGVKRHKELLAPFGLDDGLPLFGHLLSDPPVTPAGQGFHAAEPRVSIGHKTNVANYGDVLVGECLDRRYAVSAIKRVGTYAHQSVCIANHFGVPCICIDSQTNCEKCIWCCFANADIVT